MQKNNENATLVFFLEIPKLLFRFSFVLWQAIFLFLLYFVLSFIFLERNARNRTLNRKATQLRFFRQQQQQENKQTIR